MAAANEKQWREFWQRLEAQGDASIPWQELQAAYGEPWRAYHNLDHIGHCLQDFAAARRLAEDPVGVEAAIWFHDVIYDTHRKDNEERSAEFASGVLQRAGKAESFGQQVQMLILATKHQSEPTSKDTQLLTDIDLSILGQSPERYAEFEKQIRSEFAWVTEKDFAVGRSAVLNSFLRRDHVFTTTTFAEQYEKQARANLAWAIGRLVA